MAFIKNKIQKTSLAVKVLCLVLSVILISGAFIYANKDGFDAKGESAVNLSGKDYLSVILDRMSKGLQDDFTILEIVPYQGVGEYRYYAASAEVESGLLNKSKTEQQRFYNLQGGSGKKDQWLTINTYFSGLGYKIRYNYRADKYDISVDPLFQTQILSDKAEKLLDGNVKVNTVEANDLTEGDIKNADLIVLSSTASSENVLKAYNYITGNVLASGDAANTTGVYSKNGSGAYEELTTGHYSYITYDTYELVGTEYVSRDISWDMTKKLLEVVSTGRDLKGTGSKYITPIIMNDSLTQGSISATSNMRKLAMIVRMMDSSKYVDFVNEHMTTLEENGTVCLTPTGIQSAGYYYVDASNNYHVINDFSSEDVVNSGVYAGGDFITTTPNAKPRVANNYLVHSQTDRVTNYTKTLTASAYEGLSDRGLANKTLAEAMRYLIGCKDTYSVSNQMAKIRVLEIQPTHYFDYGNASNIASALGLDASKVSITSVSTKTLNSMTEDIISAYDIIYIGINDTIMTKSVNGTKDTIFNDKNLNGYVYLAYGDLVKASTALLGLFPWEYVKHTGNTSEITNHTTNFDKANGNRYIGSSYDSFKSNHSGMIQADKLPNYPRYVNTLKWSSDTGYEGNNDSLSHQLKNNYMYKYNNNTKIMFNDYQQEFFSTFNNSYLYGLVDILDYYSNYAGKGYDGIMDELFADKIGNCRLSDNDITAKTMNKIKNYADSGKLIVLDDIIYEKDSYNVYPTSHMYELAEYLTSAESDANCIRKSIMKESYATHVNVQAPLLEITSAPPALTYDSNGIVVMPAASSHILNFGFKTKGAANTTYKVKVIVDKNGDGIYALDGAMVTDDTNEIYKTQIYATDGNGNASLNIGVRLPDDENGLVAYKLEVVEMDNGEETNLRSAIYGYTVVKSGDAPKEIKVLQLIPYRQYSNPCAGNLDMSYKLNGLGNVEAVDGSFKAAMSKVDAETVGYKLSIETMYAYKFEEKFNPNCGGTQYTLGTSYNTEADYLNANDYDMLIIGFGDSYLNDDISNYHGAMDCINDFIKNGNAVMFSHDTMSFCTTTNYGMIKKTGASLKRAQYSFLNNSSKNNAAKICQSISQNLRDVVGLDRYGATLKTTDRVDKDKPTYANGLAPTYSKYAANKSPDGEYYVEELHAFTDWNLWRESCILYWAPDDTYSGMRVYNPYTTATGIATGTDNRGGGSTWWTNSRNVWLTDEVEKVNTGQVTMFPFKIPDILEIAGTHAQYYQLDMEADDLVVWYTLKGNDDKPGHYYNVNRKDGQNQYYIYSKGSVTYTGAGHSKIGNSEGELQLFINTIIMTIGAANSKAEIAVTNGSLAGAGFYNIYADTPDDYEIKFKVTDADLTTLEATDGRYDDLGRYKSGRIIWDKDKDGVIDPEDIVLESYGELSASGKELYNGVVNTVDIMNNPNLSEADKNEIRRQMSEENNSQFIIEATDSRNQTVTARAKITLKPLFNLD